MYQFVSCCYNKIPKTEKQKKGSIIKNSLGEVTYTRDKFVKLIILEVQGHGVSSGEDLMTDGMMVVAQVRKKDCMAIQEVRETKKWPGLSL